VDERLNEFDPDGPEPYDMSASRYICMCIRLGKRQGTFELHIYSRASCQKIVSTK
jgi:hypothetical protein